MTQLGSKVDGLSEDVHGIRDSVNDLNARMAKLDAKVTDITNRMAILQNPPIGSRQRARADGWRRSGQPGATAPPRA